VIAFTYNPDQVKGRAISELENTLRDLQLADKKENIKNKDDEVARDLKSAIAKLNKATKFLFRILSVLTEQWHPDAKLPELRREDLDRTILDAETTIQNLLEVNDRAKVQKDANKRVVNKLGRGIKTVCTHLKPFIKTVLSIAVPGSAVLLRIDPSLSCRFQFSIPLDYYATALHC
jgi:hypothetical protein